MQTLMIFPMQAELDGFLAGCVGAQVGMAHTALGRLPVVRLPDLGITAAVGGLGKTQFAVQTQHLIERGPAWNLVVCAGAAGALDDRLTVGDVVIGAETVEHDIKNQMGAPLLPRFPGDPVAVAALGQVRLPHAPFTVHVGVIASGDEDVVHGDRRRAVRELTGALAVAWEGAGGARAGRFSQAPFVEIRGISDEAGESAASDFVRNLPLAMHNVAMVVVAWAREPNGNALQ
ncbi:MAG: 5'-methylthioadenosine/S-adenosylhomocysteine nucleosidase [Caldilineaceae bacterium]